MLGPEDKEPKMIGEKHKVSTNPNASVSEDSILRLKRLLKSNKLDANKVGMYIYIYNYISVRAGQRFYAP